MADLTRQDIEDAVRGVLNSKEFAAQLQIFVSDTADARISKNLLLTFGIDTTDPEELNQTRRDMDFLRNTREWSEGELSKFLRASFWLVIAGSVTYGAFRELIKGMLK